MSWLSEHKTQIRSAVIGVIVLGAAGLAASGTYLYRQRVATEAEIAQREYESELAAAEAESLAALESQRAEEATQKAEMLENFRFDTEDNTVQWNGKTYKRNSYTKAILVAGIDRSNEMTEAKELGEAGQSDGLFLIAQDTARNELKILSIPRDTITEITITDNQGNVLGKELDHLSLAFSYGDGMHKSGEYMTEAVSEFLKGFEIDGYLAADMAIIKELNDAVGGVTVTVPQFGMEDADEAFVPGQQVTLTGDLAERFVRYRDTNLDHSAIYRMNQQKEYITQYFQALKKKSTENSQIVTELFELMEGYMVTDMAKDEYMKIALDALTSSGIGADSFYLIPGNSVRGIAHDEFYANMEDTIPLMLELFFREIS